MRIGQRVLDNLRWCAAELTSDNGLQFVVPAGCAHGYQTLAPDTELVYATNAAYAAKAARGVRYDDPLLSIEWPLPVEVIPMSRALVARALVRLGGRPVWRENVVTDNGNHILDVHDLKITDAVGLESAINQIVGVVTVGLFAARPADVVILGGPDGVRKF